MEKEAATTALITNDGVIFGILMLILGLVFWTSSLQSRFWKGFYAVIPALLLCYFLPSLLTTFGLVDPEASRLYFVASRFLLPAALVLLTVSADLPATLKLGPKALIMFFTGTLGVVIGGPLAILLTSLVAPDLVGGNGPDAVWRGMSTVAGSWIGGSPNQAALYEIFKPSSDVFSIWIAVDVIVANIWMAILLFIAARQRAADRLLKADRAAVDAVQAKAEAFELEHAKIPTTKDLIIILAVAFGSVGLAHFGADWLSAWFGQFVGMERFSLDNSFFWLVLLATLCGVVLSFTPARRLQGAGAMKVGTVFVYALVTTVGLNMNVAALLETPAYFLIGALWMAIHAVLLITVAFLIKAPSFFMATGSMANIGGAASAPVVAAAFHPSLAPVGVLLAVVGYIIGTFAGWFTGLVMAQIAAGV